MNEQNQQIDKDGIFLTENIGGLNTVASPINAATNDSVALLNVDVTTSGTLKKRRGSKLLNDSTVEDLTHHIPIYLLDGSLIHVYLGDTDLSVQPDAYDNTTELYTVDGILPASNGYTTSYETVTDGFNTYVYFVRANAVPVVLRVTQLLVSNSGTDINIPDPYYTTQYRDTSKVTNVKFLSPNDTWYSLTSIDADTGATVLSSDPGTDGTGVLVMFHWFWFAETMWRKRENLQADLVWSNASFADSCIELPSLFTQSLLVDLPFAQVESSEAWESSTMYSALKTPIRYILPYNLPNSTAALNPLEYLPNPHGTAGVAGDTNHYCPSGGSYVRPSRRYSSTFDTSADKSTLDGTGLTHIQLGWLVYTDVAYTVPDVTKSLHVFSMVRLPFNGYSGTPCVFTTPYQTSLFFRTDLVSEYTQTGISTKKSSGNYVTLLGVKTNTTFPDKVKVTYLINEVTSTFDEDVYKWFSFTTGSGFGIKGDYLLVTETALSSFVGTAAVAGKNDTSITDGGYCIKWGLYEYMNYLTGSFASVVGSYQNRLVLAGFLSNPGTVLMSNIGNNDETTLGDWALSNRGFDTRVCDLSLATSPLAVDLNLEAGEKIVDMKQWFDDLFVGTNRSLYRIHGGDGVAVTGTNYFVSKVANVGTVHNGMTLTEDGIVFMSASGVYTTYLDSASVTYKVKNISTKIRNGLVASMSPNQFESSVCRVSYDNVNLVLYVLLGDKTGSTYTRRCFVYFTETGAWTEYAMYNGYMNAVTVANIGGRTFFGLNSSSSSYSTIGEFNIDYVFTDLVSNKTLAAASDIGYDLDEPTATWSRSSYLSNSDVVLTTEPSLNINPITDFNDTVTISNGTDEAVYGTDFHRHTRNRLVVDGSTYWTGVETLTMSLFQEESNPYVLNVYSVSDEDWLEVADLTYTDHVNVRSTPYDGESVVTSLSYPCWWISPAFTRASVSNLKRVRQLITMFENELSPSNNTYTAPSWDALYSFNLSVLQNGTSSGQTVTADSLTNTDIRDIVATEPAWLDFFRLTLPIKGSFVSFQASVHSFDRGHWELVGYELDTMPEGFTGRRAFNE